MPGYDPKFVQAAQQRTRDMMVAKNTEAERYHGNATSGSVGQSTATPSQYAVRGIQIEFLANGFLVAPQVNDYGPSYPGAVNRVAYVARDKDELLNLVGEMIAAHAT